MSYHNRTPLTEARRLRKKRYTLMGTYNIAQSETPDLIRNHKPFTAGRFVGDWALPGEMARMGNLPNEWIERFRVSFEKNDDDGMQMYVVRSYETPIAWYQDGDWTLVPLRFSHTTTAHQGWVLQGLGESGDTMHDWPSRWTLEVPPSGDRRSPYGPRQDRGGDWK